MVAGEFEMQGSQGELVVNKFLPVIRDLVEDKSVGPARLYTVLQGSYLFLLALALA